MERMSSFRSKPVGWRYESHRHSLAARGYRSVLRDNPEDIIAAKRFGKKNIKNLQKIGQGSDRVVYDLGKGKVLKVARTARGLVQNEAEQGLNDYTFEPEQQIQIHESGKDYVVAEKAEKADKKVRDFLKPLQKFSPKDFEDKKSELQDEMNRLGLGDYMNYDLAWGDFTMAKNWGLKDGKPVLVDGGALSKRDMFINNTRNKRVLHDALKDGAPNIPQQYVDWEKIKRERRMQR